METCKLTFLIVDDEDHNRRFIARAVKNSYPGAEIEEATDGCEAGDKISALLPTLVILDTQLPKLNGVKVCELVRADQRMKDVKILAITGYDAEEACRQIMEAGADEFLGKPFSIQELTSKIDTLIARSGR